MLDLILRRGTVIDPAQSLNATLDVGISNGKIQCLSEHIEEEALVDIAVKNLLVIPGLIDMHTHVYWGGTSLSVDPNDVTINPGVTTLVDAGSAGPGNMRGFAAHIVEQCSRRVYAFINLSFPGLFGFFGNYRLGELVHRDYVNFERLHAVITEYPEIIKGVKVRLDYIASSGQGYSPLLWALEALHSIDSRLMVHFGKPPPVLSEFIHLMRPGDILTHLYRGMPNSIVDSNGEVMEEIRTARARGVIMDVGHGVGSMSFGSARAAVGQGFYPDTISSDLHVDSVNQLRIGLLEVMSRLLALGMPLEEVIAATTIRPARILGVNDQIGSLIPGYVADITVLKCLSGRHVFRDPNDEIVTGDTYLYPILVVIGGCVHRFNEDFARGGID
jgi:dihydroorotase